MSFFGLRGLVTHDEQSLRFYPCCWYLQAIPVISRFLNIWYLVHAPLSTTAVNTCIRPYSASLSFIVQAFTFHISIMEHVLHHIDVWTSTFLFWFLPRIEGKVCVLVEAEGHVMTTAVISCCTNFCVVRVVCRGHGQVFVLLVHQQTERRK